MQGSAQLFSACLPPDPLRQPQRGTEAADTFAPGSTPTCCALHRASQGSEIANLMGVVRELTESRSKAVSQRASLAERYNDLQNEYHRMLRIADLSRTVRWAAC